MSDDLRDIPATIPILPLLETVVYPLTVVPLAITQQSSLSLIDAALATDGLVGLVARSESATMPDDQLIASYRVGTIARIHRLLRLPDGSLRIAVEGLVRFELGEIVQDEPWICAHIQVLADVSDVHDARSLGERVSARVCEVLNALPGSSGDLQAQIEAEDDLERRSFLAAQAIMTRRPLRERQELLAQTDPIHRLERLLEIATEELNLVHRSAALPEPHPSHNESSLPSGPPTTAETPNRAIFDVAVARRLLAEHIIGYEALSEELISYVAVFELRRWRGVADLPNQIAPLCLIGAASTGKSALVQALARVSGHAYQRVAADTLFDAESLARALHRTTHAAVLLELDGVERMEHRVALALATLLDSGEYHVGQDGAGSEEHAQPAARALLLMVTARDVDTIAPALRERLELVHMPVLSDAERFQVVREIMLPAICATHALKADELLLSDAELRAMIEHDTGPGLLGVAHHLAHLCRTAVMRVLAGFGVVDQDTA